MNTINNRCLNSLETRNLDKGPYSGMDMAYNSSNPVFQPKFWNTISGNNRMTFEGTLQKIGILFGLMTISALGTVVVGFMFPAILFPMMLFGMFGTIGIAVYLMFSRPSNPQTPVSYIQQNRIFAYRVNYVHLSHQYYVHVHPRSFHPISP